MIGLSSRLLLLVAALEVSPPPPSRHPRVVGPGRKEQICVVGAGPAGVHMAYSLKKRGYSSVVVLERTDRVGGKCLDSHYRGVVWPLGAGVTVAHYSRNIIPLAAEFGFNDYTNAGNGSEFLGKVFKIVTKVPILKEVTSEKCNSVELNTFSTYLSSLFGVIAEYNSNQAQK